MWTHSFSRAGASLLDLLYPPHCPGCGCPIAARAALCPRCHRGLPWLQAPLCSICGIPLQGTVGTCPDCPGRDPAFRAGRSALAYQGAVQRVVLDWKYRGIRLYAPLARGWLLAYIRGLPAARYAALDALVPVPLHPQRLRWRGFNQATELATAISAFWELPIWEGVLLRTRHTPPQQRQESRTQRWHNLEGAFACIDPELVQGKALCLVDDVATTGATLHACALALRTAGARSVTFLTLARQLSRELRCRHPQPWPP
ncbi:MAG TPA: ComF family protein [bacterium]|nr:ComF family protein [bacterium]